MYTYIQYHYIKNMSILKDHHFILYSQFSSLHLFISVLFHLIFNYNFTYYIQ